MDSTPPLNMTPKAAPAMTSPDGGAASGESPTLDFAALLAPGLAPPAPAGPSSAQEPYIAIPEDPALAAAADAAQPDLAALLLPAAWTAAQPPATPMQPGDLLRQAQRHAVAPENASSAIPAEGTPPPAGTARRAAKFAADGEPLPAAATDSAVTTRTMVSTETPPLAAAAGFVTPDLPVAGWPAQPAAAAHSAPPVIHRVEIPVSQSGWQDAFSSRVVWMAGQHEQSAELHVHPPELGPIDIVLSYERDQAHVHFSSAHLPVREAIEAALPTLRDALGQAGIQLGNTSVSAQGFNRPGEQPGREQGQRQGTGRPLATGVVPERPIATRIGLVDIFA